MFILAEDFEILGFTQEKLVLLYFGGNTVWLNGGNAGQTLREGAGNLGPCHVLN